jgi:hypothetical protein
MTKNEHIAVDAIFPLPSQTWYMTKNNATSKYGQNKGQRPPLQNTKISTTKKLKIIIKVMTKMTGAINHIAHIQYDQRDYIPTPHNQLKQSAAASRVSVSVKCLHIECLFVNKGQIIGMPPHYIWVMKPHVPMLLLHH